MENVNLNNPIGHEDLTYQMNNSESYTVLDRECSRDTKFQHNNEQFVYNLQFRTKANF